MASTAPQDFGTPFLLEEYMLVTPLVTPDSPPLCAVCHTPTSPVRCSTCKTIHYCSSTYQTLDWPSHKLLCKHFSYSSRLNPSYRRALYLPDTSSKPRFIWLQYSDDGLPREVMKCFLGTHAATVKTIAFHNRYLPYWIRISYDSNPNGHTLTENKTKASIWRGPLVVVTYSAKDGLSKPALDIDTSVLGPVVGYLRFRNEYKRPVFVKQPQEWWAEGSGKRFWERRHSEILRGG
ncbi:hypothetical protein BU25DRAFT_340998 [Macroventuria anomochaeta]|uniref:Uncharacterized protein n=1 Tax=Macroventuria anomochaeta TaxID=301207 RepID=A0ACB6S2U4_9PLEO|nr:uncharacterized protein BU25DRAFT_340998 [Macroventuria anomochaeta]KAF2627519.1 hypothetical protein BU25DRAFT_340998 [Macroventuria anomochaeta]